MSWYSRTFYLSAPSSSPCQTTVNLQILEEVVVLLGVPKATLSDRGMNFLSHLMHVICALLGTKKLNNILPTILNAMEGSIKH